MRTAHRRCRGFSLIETAIALTAGSSIMMVAVALLHRSLQLSRVARQQVTGDYTQERFVEQFRKDVSRATNGQMTPNGRLRLEMANTAVIDYSSHGCSVQRRSSIESRDSDAADTHQIEQFTLGDQERCVFATIDDGQFAVLTVTRRSDQRSVMVLRRTEVAIAGLIPSNDGLAMQQKRRDP